MWAGKREREETHNEFPVRHSLINDIYIKNVSFIRQQAGVHNYLIYFPENIHLYRFCETQKMLYDPQVIIFPASY